MVEPVICLGCGGYVDEGQGIPEGEEPCACPPPSLEARTVLCASCGGALRVGARACPFCKSTVASRRCPGCFAWNLAEAQHCHACARRFVAEREGESTELVCPRCAGTLSARHYAELDVDECDGCGGIFVSPRMMDRIVAERDSSTNLRLAVPARPGNVELTVRYVLCPTCHKAMNRRAFGRISGVVVDVCREDGVWFDPGELTQVLAFIEHGGLARARKLELEEMAAAARAARGELVRATMSHGINQSAALEHSSSWRRPGGPRGGWEILDMFVELWR